jgi:hypothetical protein
LPRFRLSKEVSLYQKEYEEQKIVIEKLKDSNGDEWELKNAVRRKNRVTNASD